MLETAAVAATIRQLRERARAALCLAFTQRQRGRVFRQEWVTLKQLRGATGAAARPDLHGAETAAEFRGPRGRRIRPWRAAARHEPIRGAGRGDDQCTDRCK